MHASFTPHSESWLPSMEDFQATLSTVSRLFYHRNGVWVDVLSSVFLGSEYTRAYLVRRCGWGRSPNFLQRDTESRIMSGLAIDHKHTQSKQWVAQRCTYAHKPPRPRPWRRTTTQSSNNSEWRDDVFFFLQQQVLLKRAGAAEMKSWGELSLLHLHHVKTGWKLKQINPDIPNVAHTKPTCSRAAVIYQFFLFK